MPLADGPIATTRRRAHAAREGGDGRARAAAPAIRRRARPRGAARRRCRSRPGASRPMMTRSPGRVDAGERGEDANRVGRQRVASARRRGRRPRRSGSSARAVPSVPNSTRPSPTRSMRTSGSSASGVVPGITSWRVTWQPLSSELGLTAGERERQRTDAPRRERRVATVRPSLRRRGISCIFYRFRRDTDRCDRPWAGRGAPACLSSGAGWPSPLAGARLGAAARLDRARAACAGAAARLRRRCRLRALDLHVEQLLADVAADAAHHLAEDRRSLPSCTPASDPSGRSRAGRCPRAAPPST